MTLKRRLWWALCMCIAPLVLPAQVSILTNWDYRRQSDKYEKIQQVLATSHGLIIGVGETYSPSMQDKDGLFIVADALTGETKSWITLGGIGDQSLFDVVQNADGTLTGVGYTTRTSKQKDGWVIRIELSGEILDEKVWSMFPDQDDYFQRVALNEKGHILALGQQQLNRNSEHSHLIRIDGDRLEKIDGAALAGIHAKDVCSSGDHFVVVGVSSDKKLGDQITAAKVDIEGKLVWNKLQHFGDRFSQKASSINPASLAGGYVISGTTQTRNSGTEDMWLIKIDERGDLQWDRTFGGNAADIASQCIELSNGGYALFGHTWSHSPSAKQANLRLYVTDSMGKEMDRDQFYVVEGRGDAISYGMTESYATNNILLAGNTNQANQTRNTTTFLSSFNYFSEDLALRGNRESLGESGERLEIGTGFFIDPNANNYIESGERAYAEFEISNVSDQSWRQVVAEISGANAQDLGYWKEVFLGSLGPNQSKSLRIPVKAQRKLAFSNYRLELNLKADGLYGGSTSIDIACNQPSPANLIVSRHHFTPALDLQPNEPITLEIELTNLGGAATSTLQADFHIPPGVKAQSAERITIPAIPARQNYKAKLVFSYPESFQEPYIQISFEAPSSDQMVGFNKQFSVEVPIKPLVSVEPQQPENEAVAAAPENEIFWVTYADADEYRTIDVNRRDLNLKAMALSNQKMSKRNFAVLINGRRIQGQKMDESKLSPPKKSASNRVQHYYENIIRLREGLNEIQLVYLSEDGEVLGSSSPLKFHYIPKENPVLHVVSIGVKHPDLDYTINDARAFADMYARLRDAKGRGFKKVNVIQMTTDQETASQEIKKCFLKLSKSQTIKDNDLLVVFISSHGKVLNGDRYVLLPSDYDPQFDELTTIDFEDDILKRLRSVDGNKLVFIDACHSGTAGSRSFSDAAASKVMNDLIQATSGLEIFASCADREYSYEDKLWQHGAFTKAIIEAFKNQRVEVDGQMIQADIYDEIEEKKPGSDGVITIEELKLFVQKRVPHLVKEVKNKPQNPVNKSTEQLPAHTGIYMIN